MKEHNIVIIGGGLAGLTTAIHLAMSGHDVAVFEPNAYPNHKVCGEYVSKEVTPYLKRLGVDLVKHNGVEIDQFQISTPTGRLVNTTLPLGGIGISRYAFDNILYKRALELGVLFYVEKVTKVAFNEDAFILESKSYKIKTNLAIGAYGKRSILDKKLNRDFSNKKQSWLAVKAHYTYPAFPEKQVALHNFKGGYGGLSKTEKGVVNFCYLVHYDSFKNYKDVKSFNSIVVCKNPHLKQFLDHAQPLFESPLTIAQIAFDKKESVVNHMLMCGDTAGLIHPLCGNGMAMAIHSAKIVSELTLKYMSDKEFTRVQLEKEYALQWKSTFASRLWFGRKLQRLLMNETLTNIGVHTIGSSERIVKYIIGKTHGERIM